MWLRHLANFGTHGIRPYSLVADIFKMSTRQVSLGANPQGVMANVTDIVPPCRECREHCSWIGDVQWRREELTPIQWWSMAFVALLRRIVILDRAPRSYCSSTVFLIVYYCETGLQR